MAVVKALDAKAPDADRIGVFGKVPTRGDFVAIGLDPAIRTALDQWLQGGLAAFAQSAGAGWTRQFEAMPVWRFIIMSGVWSRSALAGVLMSSRDRVGRSFPLVLVAQLRDFADRPRQLYADMAWFTAAEDMAAAFVRQDAEVGQVSNLLKQLRLPRKQDDADAAAGQTTPASLWWKIDPTASGRAVGFTTHARPGPQDFLRLFEHHVSQPSRTSSKAVTTARPTVKPVLRPLVRSVGHATHPGTRSPVNADRLLSLERPLLAAVADGIGDDARAAGAARAVIEALSATEDTGTMDALIREIKGKLGRAHGLLQSAAAASVVVCAMCEGSIALVWAGDARCYLLRDGLMRCLTRDHVDVGIRRTLANAVGLHRQFVPDMVCDEARDGDRLVLCSAPLARSVSERGIADILLSAPIDEAADILVQEGLIGNCRDNLSAVIVDIRRS
jgi:type VI secretion system protein ImpM